MSLPQAMETHFFRFSLSVDEIIGIEDQVILATMSRLMVEKMEETSLHVKGWVNVRIAIMVARLYS